MAVLSRLSVDEEDGSLVPLIGFAAVKQKQSAQLGTSDSLGSSINATFRPVAAQVNQYFLKKRPASAHSDSVVISVPGGHGLIR